MSRVGMSSIAVYLGMSSSMSGYELYSCLGMSSSMSGYELYSCLGMSSIAVWV